MQTALSYIQSELQGLYPETEIKSFSYLILEKLTGFSRTEIYVNKNTLFSVDQQHIIESFIEKLKKQVPIQYVLGETEFFGLPFYVNESVLIPRPETEELVDWIRNENNNCAELKILDIGTGSGCIAIALKHEFTNSIVDAFDISLKALETAQSNADRNKLKINFTEVDILNASDFTAKWDIIISNPPYVTEKEKSDMLPNVLDYEPHLALFVPNNDPLLFYRKIAEFARQHLHPNGKLYFEINREAGKPCIELLSGLGFHDVELKKDLSGNNRMVRAIRNA
ncbi:MAG: peptide chain release factor N(5)-glutamine methyltransferase [Bacteroidota bacterium]|nr:peptide chain release factor N(5)-glutamine methyltransferase [Bacteroidota bacterium]